MNAEDFLPIPGVLLVLFGEYISLVGDGDDGSLLDIILESDSIAPLADFTIKIVFLRTLLSSSV